MNLYAYTAILSKTMLLQGKITYTDKRSPDCTISIPLDSVCVTGHILAMNNTQAKEFATKEMLARYPSERGYANHENVVVQEMSENEVSA